VAIDSVGNVYVNDTGYNRVQKLPILGQGDFVVIDGPSVAVAGSSVILVAPPGASHQWRKNGVDMVDEYDVALDYYRISGTQTRFLTFESVRVSDYGWYTCVYGAEDGSKTIYETEPFELYADGEGEGLPVAAWPAAIAFLGAAAWVRRRRR
jgi:hypothetical protein